MSHPNVAGALRAILKRHTMATFVMGAVSVLPLASEAECQTANVRSGDSAAVRKALLGDASNFLAGWQEAWKQSNNAMLEQRTTELPIVHLRFQFMHCHLLWTDSRGFPREFREGYNPVWAQMQSLSKCQSWLFRPIDSLGNASVDIDRALSTEQRRKIRDSRAALIVQLSAARDRFPDDAWIVGQLVRFLVEQREWQSAIDEARKCRVDRWWCNALAGYALARAGSMRAADSLFAEATSSASASFRCDWTDVSVLLEHRNREVYRKLPCAQRDSLATIYLWLADPLLSTSVNERRVEHFARKVLVYLHSSLREDGLFHWDTKLGGDATAELLMRFGWPSRATWMGSLADASHADYVAVSRASTAAPYSTAEYSAGRVQFGPSLPVLLAPFQSWEGGWELRPPEGKIDVMTPGPPERYWWPSEHMSYPSRSFLQLPIGQTAVLRRQSSVRLATAIDVTDDDATLQNRLIGRMLPMNFLVSDGPESVELIAQTSARFSRRFLLDGVTKSRPFLVAVESEGTSAFPVALRTRFGITPPQSLDSLEAASIAVSAPLFFSTAVSGRLPADADEAIEWMIGRNWVARGSRVGVFWETYGAEPTDTITVELSVRKGGENLLRRVGAFFRLVPSAAAPVRLSWEVAPRPNRDAKARAENGESARPILPQSVILNLPAEAVGTHLVSVKVRTKTRAIAVGESKLVIR